MRKALCTALSLGILVPALAFAQGETAAPANPPAANPAGVAPAVAAANPVVAKLNEMQPKRDDPTALKEMDALVAQGLKENPSVEMLVAASRHKYWHADGATDGSVKKQLGKEAWELAEKALALKADSPEANWNAARGIGAYSQGAGILTALTQGLEGKYNNRLDFAIQHLPDIDFGGPLVAKGRYHFELPWPKRDLRKSIEYFRKVNQKYPMNLRAYYYLAETLLKDGKAKLAKLELEKALNGSVDYDPPEGRRVKGWAKTLAVQIDKELE
jgi:tetratricopeptide (TPR) repeat protein